MNSRVKSNGLLFHLNSFVIEYIDRAAINNSPVSVGKSICLNAKSSMFNPINIMQSINNVITNVLAIPIKKFLII